MIAEFEIDARHVIAAGRLMCGDTARPMINGVLVEFIDGKGVRAVATDTFTLGVFDPLGFDAEPAEHVRAAVGCLLPAELVKAITRQFIPTDTRRAADTRTGLMLDIADNGERVTAASTAGIFAGCASMYGPNHARAYPNYRGLIPTGQGMPTAAVAFDPRRLAEMAMSLQPYAGKVNKHNQAHTGFPQLVYRGCEGSLKAQVFTSTRADVVRAILLLMPVRLL